MIDIDRYLAGLIEQLIGCFGRRLIYVGLQGSYLRCEANSDSDIDVMVVIDHLQRQDLDSYRNIIRSLDEPDKSCGFICSKSDLDDGILLKSVIFCTQQKTITEN